VIRFVLRFVALLMLAGAFAAAVIDGARSLADQKLEFYSMGWALAHAFPSKFPLLQPFVEKHFGPRAWDPALLDVLSAPAFVELAVVGFLLFAIARPRAPRDRGAWRR
jgi:hypothetical protein